MPHRDDTDVQALLKQIQYHRYGDPEEMLRQHVVDATTNPTVTNRTLTFLGSNGVPDGRIADLSSMWHLVSHCVMAMMRSLKMP
jgi:hypothetical protein